MSFPSLLHSARRLCRKAALARYLSQQTGRDGTTHGLDQGLFEAAGLRPAVAASLRVAFPNVREPTAMQRKLMRAMTQSRDVLLQDDTGTGKSFAAMLALLSKLPADGASSSNEDTLIGLLIVPHRDLAYQYLHWLHRMTLPDGDVPSPLAKLAQVLVRRVDRSTLQALPIRMQEAIKSASSDKDQLIHRPPHILIVTPNALLELTEHRPAGSRLPTPSVVVVDEADALLRVPSSKLSKGRGKVPREQLGRHIPDLVRVLDGLYPASREKHSMCARPYSVQGESHEHGHAVSACRPQLVMISATLRNKLRSALFDTYGWIRQREVLKLIKRRSPALPTHRLGRSAVHHVLVVSKTGDIKNIAGARPLQPDATRDASRSEEGIAESSDEGDDMFYEDDGAELVGDVDKALLRAPLPLDPAMLEAVAATFALDVPRIALLVLPATAGVRKIVFELQQMGVNAHPLDLVANEASRAHMLPQTGDVSDGNPVLIVATLATVRGIDLPDLSHVFMLGVPEGRSGDAYLHVAGRVGRFGRRGKVVTVVEERREERRGTGVVVVEDGPRRMAALLARIGVHPSRLAHFE